MNARLPIIRLRPHEGWRARNGAPGAFSNESVMDGSAKALVPGSLVELAAEDGAGIGIGYFNPKSLIAIRLLAKPREKIDAAFFAEKFRRARALREHFYDTSFYRLVHAEGDGLPGLVIDLLREVCVVQITPAGMERFIEELLQGLDAAIAPKTLILRNDTPARALE